MTKSIPPFATLQLSADRVADLRSNLAGEHGAVAIYCGILAVTRNDGVCRFAKQHLRTEVRHRRFFLDWLPRAAHSRLMPTWWAAGWLLGASAAMFGENCVFRTIAAVESFVERHYTKQIIDLSTRSDLHALADLLQAFCDDEAEHQLDAAGRIEEQPGRFQKIWMWTIAAGSTLGVAVARRV